MSRLRSVLCWTIPTALLSAGLSLYVLSAAVTAPPVFIVCLYALVSSGLLCGLDLLPDKRALRVLEGLSIALLLTAVFGLEPGHSLYQAGRALYLSVTGVENALLPFRSVLVRAVPVLFSLFLFQFADTESFSVTAAFAGVTVMLTYIAGGGQGELLYLIPALVGLILHLSMSHTEEFYWSVLLVGAVLAAAAFFLTPSAGMTDKTLADAAEDLRETIEDYFYTTEGRVGFTLETEGYLPLSDRLGGKAAPEPHTVLEVDTDERLYLRAVAYNEYTGLQWRDTLSAQRYLWAGIRARDLKADLFDFDRPNAALPQKQATVHVLREGATTLFLPWRVKTLELQSERMVPYFNSGSEIFITRALKTGDVYSFIYSSVDADDAADSALIQAAEQAEDARYETVCGQYLSLPSHMQSEIYDMAREAAGSAADALGKAKNIRRYLVSNYAYTLDVGDPPDNVDFVTWFLLREKKGYCTYFASAMTVLCRMAGIPARYVTGFLAEPDESGKAIVTGDNAHAWTEIYLNGVGWVTLEATPEHYTGNDSGAGDAPNEQDDADTPTPTPAGEDEDSAAPDPSADGENGEDGAASPTPTPSLSSDEEDADGQEDQETPTPPPDENGDGDASNDDDSGESPSPTPDETNEPEEQDPLGSEASEDSASPWLWIFVVILLILLAVFLFWWTDPLNRAKRHPERAVEILVAAMLAMLAADGHPRAASDTLNAYAAQIAAFYPTLPLQRLLADYQAALYGRRRIDAAPFFAACRALRALKPLSVRRFLAGRRKYKNHP